LFVPASEKQAEKVGLRALSGDHNYDVLTDRTTTSYASFFRIASALSQDFCIVHRKRPRPKMAVAGRYRKSAVVKSLERVGASFLYASPLQLDAPKKYFPMSVNSPFPPSRHLILRPSQTHRRSSITVQYDRPQSLAILAALLCPLDTSITSLDYPIGHPERA
jgi:hypothetical protein